MITYPPKRPYPQAHLPALQPDEAWLLVSILNCIRDAIFRAHGDAMRQWIDADAQPISKPTDPARSANNTDSPV